MKNKFAYLILFGVAIIWGGGYIACEYAFKYSWSPFSILFQRNIIGFLITFIICFKNKPWKNKKLIITASIAGVLYFLGYAFQLEGQKLTTVSNTGLITSLGIILVPIFYWIFFKKRPALYSFVSCFFGLLGAFILSYNPGFKFHIGDILVAIGAVAYAIHLTYVGKNGDNHDLFSFICVSFLTMSILSFLAIIVSGSKFIGESKGWFGVLYFAIISGVLGVSGQYYCQRIIESYKVSLILTLEGLFAAIFGVLLLHEKFTWQIGLGGAIMIFSVLFLQLNEIKNRKIEEEEICKTQ